MVLAGFLGLVVGYLAFHTAFPNVSVPATGNPSLLPVLAALFGSAVLVGLLTDELQVAILQVFAAIPLGLAVASALALSPVLTGIVVAQSSDIVFFVVRLGLPVFLLALLTSIFGSVLGMAMQRTIGLDAGYGQGRSGQ